MTTHTGALKLLTPVERADYDILKHLGRDERLRSIKRADLVGWQPDPKQVNARQRKYEAKPEVKAKQREYRAKPEVKAKQRQYQRARRAALRASKEGGAT